MSGSRFEIPEFQRDYAWGDEEVKEFWADLRDAIESDFYFLGLIILTGTGDKKQVVDGQQRLITLSLLAAALRQAASRSGRNAIASELESTFIAALDYERDERVLRIRLTSDRDRATYDGIIDLDSPAPSEAEPSSGGISPALLDGAPDLVSKRLMRSFEILSESLEEDLRTSDTFSKLGQWARFLKDRLFFAVFEHPDAASAFRVFEVVNTRGKELTTADLLKSLVLSRTPAELRDARYVAWTQLVESFVALGYSSQLVQYIRHVVTLREGHVAPRDLYDEISKNYGHPGGLEQLMSDLEKRLNLYLQMIEPSLDGPAEPEHLGVFSALNQLGIIVVRPLLLAISDTESSQEGMKRVLQLVVRRIVVGYLGTGNIERRFSQAAKRVADAGEWAPILAELSDLSPPREEFQRQLAERSMNKRVLSFLHESILTQTLTPASKSELYLHNVRPRVAPQWDSFPDEQFTRWGSTIGNSILATQERRPRGTNTWEGFLENLLPLVDDRERGLVGDNHWDVSRVKQFGNDLAERGASLWYDNSET